jgi:hypothetical protein
MLLAQPERPVSIADRLARVIPDGRDTDRVVYLLPDILRARIFAIACGHEDADDLDRLRFDPALNLASGRLPDTAIPKTHTLDVPPSSLPGMDPDFDHLLHEFRLRLP